MGASRQWFATEQQRQRQQQQARVNDEQRKREQQEAKAKPPAAACYWCGLPMLPRSWKLPPDPDEWTTEHILPRSHGGLSHPENLAYAHYRCNQARGSHLDWLPFAAHGCSGEIRRVTIRRTVLWLTPDAPSHEAGRESCFT